MFDFHLLVEQLLMAPLEGEAQKDQQNQDMVVGLVVGLVVDLVVVLVHHSHDQGSDLRWII